MRTLILGLFMLVLLGFLLEVTEEAKAGDFYQYTDSDGVVSFSDSEKAVPQAHKANAVKRNMSEIDVNLTPYKAVDTLAYRAGLADRLAELRHRYWGADEPAVKACTGHITENTVRRQVGDYNRRFFIVTDECGRTVSVTRDQPTMQINR